MRPPFHPPGSLVRAFSYGAKALSDDDILREAREAFERAADAEAENRREALDDLRFARLGEQWPDAIRRERELDGRPCLTLNRLSPSAIDCEFLFIGGAGRGGPYLAGFKSAFQKAGVRNVKVPNGGEPS